MHDVLDYHIHIENFSNLLGWLTFLCLLGLCLTSWPMLVMSRFFLTKTGTRFSIIDFELPYAFGKFKAIMDNITERTKDTVRMNLKLDYYFMPFAYLFLFFGGWFMIQRHHLFSINDDYCKILFLPFAAWLMDIIENKLAFACLETLTKTNSRLLFFVSLIKWILIFGYLILLFIIDQKG